MSLAEWSSKFPYSQQLLPVPSPCGKYVASTHASNIVIRSVDTLNVIRTISSGDGLSKVTKVIWEPIDEDKESNKLALLLENQSLIKIHSIFDESVNISIKEDKLFGIETFQWLTQNLIIVFTENELLARFFDLKRQLWLSKIEKPKFDKVLLKKDPKMFTAITQVNSKYFAKNYVISDDSSSASLLYNCEIGPFLNLSTPPKWSPNDQWLLCSDNLIGAIKISVFTIFGKNLNGKGPLFEFESSIDFLGSIQQEWLSDEKILITDHHEEVIELDFSMGLKVAMIYKHNGKVQDSIIWKQDIYDSKFIKKPSNFKIPRIENLPLHMKGISKLLSDGDHLFTTTKSMPNAVFIWRVSIETTEPTEILIFHNNIKDLIVTKQIDGLLLVVSEDSLSVWYKDLFTPLNISVGNDGDDMPLIKQAKIINIVSNTIEILVNLQDSFTILQLHLPLAIKETPGNSVQILRQQRTYVNDTSRLDDTFMNKRVKREAV